MNINSKFNREEETVTVSNKEGIMDIREYQDNIDDILVLEDVIEELENILEELGEKKEKIRANIPQLSEEYLYRKNKSRRDIIWCTTVMLMCTVIGYICSAEYYGFNFSAMFNEIIQNSKVLCTTLVGSGIGFIGCIWYGISMHSIRKGSNPQQKLENAQKEEKNLDLEISLLEQKLIEKRNQLNYMKENKSKNNMKNMSTEVKIVFYQEELELQKAYLKQMYQDNCEAQEEHNSSTQENMILGRFKKKKGN